MVLNVDKKLLDLVADREACPNELRYEFGNYLIKLFDVSGEFISITKEDNAIVLFVNIELEDGGIYHGAIHGVGLFYDKIIKESQIQKCELTVSIK